MDVLDISRWQFGITTIYHFILVPLTIGLAPILAFMQTLWVVTGNPIWYRLVKFFGKIFLINFALGVATGIVQEFQFGMAWAQYSKFVGDIFGAPLAVEGLVAFFMESTFLGLWIFGWDRLPKKVHLACIWIVAIGVNASAYFIVVANSWMQHPVGARYNAEKGRAELTDVWAVFTNNTALTAFPHVVAGSFLTAATLVAGVATWWMVRDARAGNIERSRTLWRPATRLSLVVMVAAAIALAITGDAQGKLMFKQQPMKMASAEALCETETGADFSLLSVGTNNNCAAVHPVLKVPNLTSFLATNTFDSTLQGVPELQAEYEQKYGPGDYRPNLFVTYWAFRAMITWAGGSAVVALLALWFTRKRRVPDQKWVGRVAILMIPTPFLANISGWIFTEMGRQPWVVAPNPETGGVIRQTVREGVTQHGATAVWISLSVLTTFYGILAIIWFALIRKYVVAGPLPHDEPHDDSSPPGRDDPDDPDSGADDPDPGADDTADDVRPLSFAY